MEAFPERCSEIFLLEKRFNLSLGFFGSKTKPMFVLFGIGSPRFKPPQTSALRSLGRAEPIGLPVLGARVRLLHAGRLWHLPLKHRTLQGKGEGRGSGPKMEAAIVTFYHGFGETFHAGN